MGFPASSWKKYVPYIIPEFLNGGLKHEFTVIMNKTELLSKQKSYTKFICTKNVCEKAVEKSFHYPRVILVGG